MKRILSFFILFLFVFGCNEPFQEEITPELKSGMTVERTIKFIKAIGTMELTMNWDACPDLGYQMVITGGGNATFLGNFTVKNTVCVDANGIPVSPFLGELTAANGDMIYTMVTQPPWEENGMIHYYYSIRSELCTGRFEDAFGYIIMYGFIDYDAMTWNLKGEGKITY